MALGIDVRGMLPAAFGALCSGQGKPAARTMGRTAAERRKPCAKRLRAREKYRVYFLINSNLQH